MKAILLLVVLFSGCSEESTRAINDPSRNLYPEIVYLMNGRKVECVVFAAGYQSGLSCDWEHVKP